MWGPRKGRAAARADGGGSGESQPAGRLAMASRSEARHAGDDTAAAGMDDYQAAARMKRTLRCWPDTPWQTARPSCVAS